MEAAGGVHEHELVAHGPRLVEGGAEYRARLAELRRVVDLEGVLVAEGAELLARGRTVHVGRDEQRVVAGLDQPAPQLGRRRGLARALQPGHEDHGREAGRRLQTPGLRPSHQLHHLVPHHADHGLGGSQALQDILAGCARAHALEELLDDLEMDVGLEQGETDVAQRDVDVRLREGPVAAEVAEDALELVAERVEHDLADLKKAAGVAADTPPTSALPRGQGNE